MNPTDPTSGINGPTSPLYGFWAIAQKETLHIRRDPITLIFALVIPIVQLILLGYAVDFDVRHVRTAFVDFDHSRESREYLASLQEYAISGFRLRIADSGGGGSGGAPQ